VVFGDDVYRVRCAEHVWGRWSEHHKGMFVNYKAHRPAMGRDFDLLKKCPVLGVVTSKLLFDKLVVKFRK